MADILPTAIEAARAAGALLRELQARPRTIDHKGVINLVTDGDRRAEALLVSLIRSRFPSHSILSEEGRDHAGAADVCWILDPLDGTTNFAHGFPFYSVSVAVTVRGELAAGVVYDPNRDECFVAERGAGARMNEAPLRVSAIADLTDALLCTGFPYDIREAPTEVVGHFQAFLVRAQAVRRPGSAALDLAYVAAGRLDGFWEHKIHAWDLAAGALLVREAGGRVSDYAGNPLDMYRGEILASNGLLHDAMVKVLGRQEARRS